MRANRTLLLAIGGFALAAAIAYVVVGATWTPAPAITYDQQSFASSRTVSITGFRLQSTKVRTTGGIVDVEWYDSGLALNEQTSGAYVSLYVDGRRIASSLRGTKTGSAEVAPGTLVWAGDLPAGTHTFVVRLDRVDGGVLAPYVPAGGEGVDSLSVSQ
jgi:hypothetical protein